MIFKASSRGNGNAFCDYLQKETYDFMGAYGTISQDMRGALVEMDQVGKLSKGSKTMVHLVISPDQDESRKMTPKQWLRAVEVSMNALEMDGQPFVAVREFKDDAWHMHLAIQRGTGYSLKKDNYMAMKLFKARRALEIEFGHPITPEYNLEREQISKINREAFIGKTAEQYVSAMKEKGYEVAQNRRRDPFVLVDQKTGRTYSVSKHLDDKETKSYIGIKEVVEKLSGHPLPIDKDVITRIKAEKKMKRAEKVAGAFMENDPTGDPQRLKKKLYDSTLRDMKEAGAEMSGDDPDTRKQADFDQKRAENEAMLSEVKEAFEREARPKETEAEQQRRQYKEWLLERIKKSMERDQGYDR